MFSTLKLHFKQNKPLVMATLLSLLLHMLFLVDSTLQLPDTINDEQSFLKMRLVNLPAEKAAIPIKQSTSKAKPEKKTTKPEQTHPTIQPTPATPVTEETYSAPVAEAVTEPVTETMPTEIAAVDNIVALPAEIIPPPLPYQYVETAFDVYRNNDKSPAGKTLITFHLDQNNNYAIKSVTEANGLASIFFDTLQQKSEGVVNADGLRPNYYSYAYGNKKSQIANFAWSDGILVLHTAKGTKTETLSAGTQDLLSFMYQFMFKPPLESLSITMTNGKNLRTYTYSFEGEEFIETSFSSNLKTVHLIKTGSEEEKTEIWLAVDYKYLPIKIRKTEKDGSTVEQIMTNISTELMQQQNDE
jgi:hypothetical protein